MESEDFIQTLRVVKAHDAKLQVNRELWARVLDVSFESLLFMCIGDVCNANFATSVRQHLLHGDTEYLKHKNHVLNLFLYVAHLGVHYRLFHVVRETKGGQRRHTNDSVEYAYYFLSHLKDEMLIRVAEIIHAFCVHKRMVRVEKVVKYFKRAQIYESLRDLVNRHVTRIIDEVEEQIYVTDSARMRKRRKCQI